MEDQWARLGLDLHLTLGPAHGLRAGLEYALREAVRGGRLTPGTPLPSSRTLARDLNVSRGTVTQAYEQLVAEGYLASRPRSGIEVADHPAAPPPASIDLDPPVTLPFVKGADLRSGLPDLSAFPRREWLAATRHVMQTTPGTAFGYGDPAGAVPLREALAEYLGRVRGVVATPDRVFVCAGYTHALRLVCQALSLRGAASIAFEDPAEPAYCSLAGQMGLEVSRVPVDRDGMMVGRLTGEDVVTVTPAHQYPLGVTLSPARRTRLLAWAARTGAYVVEDDYDGEFRYDRQPVGALQGLAPDRVIYAGTASKTVAPGLRIAWIVVPPDLVRPLRESMRWDEAYVNVIEQLVFARLIRSGELDRHLRRCRIRYRRRRDRLGEAIARHVPSGRLSGIAAGLHAVLEFPGAAIDERRLLGHLRRNGVAVDGIAYFYHRPADAPLGIVIGYATPPEHAYSSTLETLISTLETMPGALSRDSRS
ncbi:PLP-dependent aminotransferase family protein [Actinomadura sp. DC4]|uniref:MocR-like pyridoxine biosynthesis transcription factor PdxR n=1 Tax=Actinomadura sp. DC4 TaxID=3055069 RepID=UPI0025AF3A75|nr:PLP-dependent aminotransferase family protein [Actinomadura sp. DC4]MDN3356929.1 PLP-dependent aminotransferase family protein [Actinomadura sp. DC4]